MEATLPESATGPLTLVADIGGTNTRVALARGRTLMPHTVTRYRNAGYAGLGAVLTEFLATQDADPDAVCVAVAGPVREGVAHMTNLDWTIDAGTLARAATAERVAILNDLQAQGYALGHIAAECLIGITEGPDLPGADRLVIGVGTGFNAAPVHRTPAGRYVAPSECGHANLPIRTEAELRLCRFVETAHGFPAIEDVLSGRGLARVYAWLGSEAGDPREATPAEIVAAFSAGTDPRAEEAARIFARILGTVAGNLALIHLPFGGIFLVGGVARAFAPYLRGLGFETAFRDKGRFAGFMGNFPVTAVTDDFAALTGCASHMAELSEKSMP